MSSFADAVSPPMTPPSSIFAMAPSSISSGSSSGAGTLPLLPGLVSHNMSNHHTSQGNHGHHNNNNNNNNSNGHTSATSTPSTHQHMSMGVPDAINHSSLDMPRLESAATMPPSYPNDPFSSSLLAAAAAAAHHNTHHSGDAHNLGIGGSSSSSLSDLNGMAGGSSDQLLAQIYQHQAATLAMAAARGLFTAPLNTRNNNHNSMSAITDALSQSSAAAAAAVMAAAYNRPFTLASPSLPFSIGGITTGAPSNDKRRFSDGHSYHNSSGHGHDHHDGGRANDSHEVDAVAVKPEVFHSNDSSTSNATHSSAKATKGRDNKGRSGKGSSSVVDDAAGQSLSRSKRSRSMSPVNKQRSRALNTPSTAPTHNEEKQWTCPRGCGKVSHSIAHSASLYRHSFTATHVCRYIVSRAHDQ
jgi:hypothetical protein